MARPLSIELRKKIVNAYHRNLGKVVDIAEIFDVSIRSVNRYLKIYKECGVLTPTPLPGRPPVLTAENLAIIKDIVLSNNDGTLQNFCCSFKEKTGITLTIVSMHNACKKLNIRRKKRVIMPQKEIVWMYKLDEKII